MTGITILLIALACAVLVGLVLRNREGKVRAGDPTPVDDRRRELLHAAGVGADAGSGAVVLHFSADWCGPCAAVRRVVGQAIADLASTPRPPVEVELDIDEYAAVAAELGVLSLPTTFILDADLSQRFRVSGVPVAGDLRAALIPLTEPPASIS